MSKLHTHIEKLRRFEFLTEDAQNALLKELRKVKLLSPGHANAKTKRGDYNFVNYIMHLAPSKLSGFNMCPSASRGCAAACLNTAGRGRFDSIQNSRIRKTLYFVKAREAFLIHLKHELTKVAAIPNAVVRLNGTSDIPWERYGIIQSFPSIQFYDYTKVYKRLRDCAAISNYHLTFSASESNHNLVAEALLNQHNVAMVFDNLPTYYWNTDVIDGDTHDFRFLDPKDVIVGLTAKGDAKKDQSGFVRRA